MGWSEQGKAILPRNYCKNMTFSRLKKIFNIIYRCYKNMTKLHGFYLSIIFVAAFWHRVLNP